MQASDGCMTLCDGQFNGHDEGHRLWKSRTVRWTVRWTARVHPNSTWAADGVIIAMHSPSNTMNLWSVQPFLLLFNRIISCITAYLLTYLPILILSSQINCCGRKKAFSEVLGAFSCWHGAYIYSRKANGLHEFIAHAVWNVIYRKPLNTRAKYSIHTLMHTTDNVGAYSC